MSKKHHIFSHSGTGLRDVQNFTPEQRQAVEEKNALTEEHLRRKAILIQRRKP